MASYDSETISDLLSRLSLPGQIQQLTCLLTTVVRNIEHGSRRSLSEVAEALEVLDSETIPDINVNMLKGMLREQALGNLLGVKPGNLAILSEEELRAVLPLLGFTPEIEPDQIGTGSIDLTLGVPSGKKAGDQITLSKGDFSVMTALERHGRWPKNLLGYVSVRSCFAQLGLNHLNSPWVYPQYERELKLEFHFLANKPLTLVYGKTRPVQLTFYHASNASNDDIEKKVNGNGGNGHHRVAEDLREMPNHQYNRLG